MKRMNRTLGIAGLAMITGLLVSCAETAAPPEVPAPEAVEKAVAAPPAADAKWISALFGEELLKPDGSKASTKTLAGKKVGIYFSAHWCPPCRGFTPVLVKTYNELAAADKAFEIVFVSFDRSADAMVGYIKETKMPWLAVPYESPLRDALAKKYGVRGIPTLVIVDDKGNTVSENARGDVASSGAAAFDKW